MAISFALLKCAGLVFDDLVRVVDVVENDTHHPIWMLCTGPVEGFQSIALPTLHFLCSQCLTYEKKKKVSYYITPMIENNN